MSKIFKKKALLNISKNNLEIISDIKSGRGIKPIMDKCTYASKNETKKEDIVSGKGLTTLNGGCGERQFYKTDKLMEDIKAGIGLKPFNYYKHTGCITFGEQQR